MRFIGSIKHFFVFSVFILIFFNCNDLNKKEKKIITIKGSDSELSLLNFFADEYLFNRPDIGMKISGGGTSRGIEALINGNADIAIASRLINQEERKKAKLNRVDPIPFIIAQDIVSIITHPETGIDSLSLDQLSQLFNGTIKNWKELGGTDMPIKIYGRDKHSGTRSYLKDKLSIKFFSSNYIELKDNNEIIDKINKEKGSIGYVNVGSIVDQAGKPSDKVWAMNLYVDKFPACSPYENQRVKYGDYPLVRPLIQYTNGKPTSELLEFINFELLEKQQNDLEKHGYLKINATYYNMNQNSFK